MRGKRSERFVFVKRQEDPTIPGKRIVLPLSLDALQEQAAIALASSPISGFYTERGQPITRIEDIKAGSTILAVLDEPEARPEDQSIDDQDIITEANRATQGKGPLLGPEEEEEEHEETLVSDHGEEEDQGAEVPRLDEGSATSASSPQLLSVLLPPQFAAGPIQKLIGRQLDSGNEGLYEQLAQEEANQHRFIFQNLLTQLPRYNALTQRDGDGTDQLIFVSAIVARARSIIAKHRVIAPGCVAHNLKTLIVGPSKSGKSTLLVFVAEQFLTELFRSHTAKRNFVLVIDAKKLCISYSQYQEFYTSLIDLTFTALRYQRPGIIPFCEPIVNFFKGIVRGVKDTALPRAFVVHDLFKLAARSLLQVASQLARCIDDPAGFEAWHTNVLLLPSLISSAFGFTQIHYIIDNVEYLQGAIRPDHPFVESHEPINVADYFKFALSSASFVFAAEKTDKALAVLGSVDPSLDLLRNLTFEDTLGVVEPESQERELMVRFAGDPRLVRFTVDDCVGCPVFLSFWEEIWREIDEIKEPWNVDVARYTEAQMFVRECLEHLLKSVFVAGGDDVDIVHSEVQDIRPVKTVA
jgi:hypothetical protein